MRSCRSCKIVAVNGMKKRQGFTLIELFIVLGVISVLATVLIPIAFNTLNQAKINDVLNYIRELYMVEMEYVVKNGETTNIDGLVLYMSADWIEEQDDLFTDWATDTNRVSFTVAFDNEVKSRALLAMLEDTKSCTSCFFDENRKDIKVMFHF